MTNAALALIGESSSTVKNYLASGAGHLELNARAAGGVDPGQNRGGFSFISFSGNDGILGFGRDKTAVPEGQEFALSVAGFKTGWSYWAGGTSEEETKVSVSAFEAAPAKPDDRPEVGAFANVKGRERDGWAKTLSISLVGVGGQLDKLDFVWEGSAKTKGYADMWGDLALLVSNRYKELTSQGTTGLTSELLHPVVSFHVRSYLNKAYKKTIYVPMYKLVGWTDGFTVAPVSAVSSPVEDPNDPLFDPLA
jgi:hypothetical protein